MPRVHRDEAGDRVGRAVRVGDVAGGAQLTDAEENGGERLPGLVVQLARDAAALRLLRVDNTTKALAMHALRKLEGDGSPGCKSSASCRSSCVKRDPGAACRRWRERRGRDPQRRAERRAPPAPARSLLALHQPRIVRDQIDSLAAPAPGDQSHLRAMGVASQTQERIRAIARSAANLDPVLLDQGDHDDARVEEVA